MVSTNSLALVTLVEASQDLGGHLQERLTSLKEFINIPIIKQHYTLMSAAQYPMVQLPKVLKLRHHLSTETTARRIKLEMRVVVLGRIQIRLTGPVSGWLRNSLYPFNE